MKRLILLGTMLIAILLLTGCPKKTQPPPIEPVVEDTTPIIEPVIEEEPIVPPPEPDNRLDLRTVYFEYDKHNLTEEAKAILTDNAQQLLEFSEISVTLEGNCDERGTEQYNLSLGQKRADAVRQFLVSYGVNSSRIKTISYGEERPLCNQSTDSCWSRNRRVEFIPQG